MTSETVSPDARPGRSGRRLRRAVLPLATAGLLATAAPAMAQDPSIDTYGGGGGDVVSSTDSGGSGSASSLPFTGFDALAIAGGGAALILLGASLRWMGSSGRRSDPEAGRSA